MKVALNLSCDRPDSAGNTKRNPSYLPPTDELADDPTGSICGNSEPNALCLSYHRGINAYDLGLTIDQWAAGVAGIKHGIGLDDIVNHPAHISLQTSSECGNNAC